MPVAGQDAVLDRPAVEREAHVRAAVVEGADPALVADHEHRPMARSPQHHAALGLQFRERADAKELVAIFNHSCPPMAGPESIDPEPSTGEGLAGRGAIAACLVLSGALPSPLASATIVALPEQARILKLLVERVDVQA